MNDSKNEVSDFMINYMNEINLKDDDDDDEVSKTLNQLLISAHNDYTNILKKIDQNLEHKCLNLIKSSTKLIELFNKDIDVNFKEEPNELVNLSSYFEDLDQISSEVQAALIVKNYKDAVDSFLQLINDRNKQIIDKEFQKKFSLVADNLLSLMINILEIDFENFLLYNNWQIEINKKTTQEFNEIEQKFSIAFFCLLILSPHQEFLSNDKKIINLKFTKKLFSLPIQILLKPYLKKFFYHFYGTKKTNNILKPEWYFMQLLLWATERQNFLSKLIQSEFEKNNFLNVEAFTEFLEGLVCFACDKIQHDLPMLLDHNNELAFVHLIDEAVHFQQQLMNGYSYEEIGRVSCMDVLSVGPCFEKWIFIEKKLAILRMDEFLASPTAWSYQEDDINRIPECGDHFLMLINTIAERNRLISNLDNSLLFANLTNSLLDDMRYRLVQIRNEILSNGQLKATTISSQFVLIINFVSILIHMVSQWSIHQFYDRLFLHNAKKKDANDDRTKNGNDNKYNENSDDSIDEYNENYNDANQFINPKNSGEKLINLIDGSFFKEILEFYDKLKNDMMSTVLKCIVDEFLKKTKLYKQNKFIPGHTLKDFVSPTLTSSACDMLNYLRQQLANLQLIFSPSLFAIFWQQLAKEVDESLTKNIIFDNHFNEAGAMQLKFDLCENLFPIFSSYTFKPDSYFKSTKECCTILTLNQGMASLLRDTLSRSMQPSVSKLKSIDPLATLSDLGVQQLSLQQVEILLSLRVDRPSLNRVVL